MYAADLKYVTGTDQLHISIFKKLVINENVKPKYLYFFCVTLMGKTSPLLKLSVFCVIC